MSGKYTTSDIALAAWLRLARLPLLECGTEDGGKFLFVFGDPEGTAEILALAFADSDCRRYDDEMRALKKILYSRRGRSKKERKEAV